MSYFRGEHYIWSDHTQLHLWTARDYSPSNEGYPAGVAIPESVMDEFAVMRFAELLALGSAAAAIESAANNENFGGNSIRQHRSALLEFATAFAAKQHL